MSEWNPIETCPEDYYVFVWAISKSNPDYGRRFEICKGKNNSGWIGLEANDEYLLKQGILIFTHWQKTPEPPTQIKHNL